MLCICFFVFEKYKNLKSVKCQDDLELSYKAKRDIIIETEKKERMKMEMTRDLERARNELENGRYTCILCKGDEMYFSNDHGVKPLLVWIRESRIRDGFAAADQIVGKAAALLYIKIGVAGLYAKVISEQAMPILKGYGIPFVYEHAVPFIMNRKGDDMCPMEKTVVGITDPESAVTALTEKVKEMSRK